MNIQEYFKNNALSSSSESSETTSSDSGESMSTTDSEKMYLPGGYCKLEIGSEIFDRFTIEKQIGKGYYALVFEATDSHTFEKVAFKIGKSHKSMYKTMREEVIFHDYLNKFPNKNICHSLFSGEIARNGQSHICILFPLMDMDLYDHLKINKENISSEFVKNTHHAILNALDHIHDLDIIHADVKPDNILLRNDEILLTDFGTASILGEREYSIIQTLPYRSPEIIIGHEFWDSKIDIWSLGCVTLEMVIGRQVFQGDDEYEVLSEIIGFLGAPPKVYLNRCSNKSTYFKRGVYRFIDEILPCPLLEFINANIHQQHTHTLALANYISSMFTIDIGARPNASELKKMSPF